MSPATGVRWPRAQALEVAEHLRRLLAPACERIEIAGSLRRGRPDVGDIELLCVPRPAQGLFEARTDTDQLDWRLQEYLAAGTLAKRPNAKGAYTYGQKNKLLIATGSGIPIDVFSTPAEHWGMALFVRTGPAEWNTRAMARFMQRGMRGHAYGGVTLADGTEDPCTTEERVFELLGWRYSPPEARR